MADDPIIKKLDDVKTSISGSIDKLAKQNAEQSRKDSETITLEENIGSLAEVAATFKAQTRQMEHEKKEKMHEVDDRLDDMLLQDEKYQKKHLAALKKTEQNDGQADSQETEVIQEEKKSRKKTSDVIKKIGKNVGKFTGLAFTMNKLGGAAKITFWGALMGGMMVALIKFLDSKTWKDFRTWVFAEKGLKKQLADMGMSWKNFHRVFFSTGQPPGPFGASWLGTDSGLGLFPFLGQFFDMLVKNFGIPAWTAIKKLGKDFMDPNKSILQVIIGNLGAVLGVGGVLAFLAAGLSPALLFAGLYVAGGWLILDTLGEGFSGMFKALEVFSIGIWAWVRKIRRFGMGLWGDKSAGRGVMKITDPEKMKGTKAFKSAASGTGHAKWDERVGRFREWKPANTNLPGPRGQAQFGSRILGGIGHAGMSADFNKSRMSRYRRMLSGSGVLSSMLKFSDSGVVKVASGMGRIASKAILPLAFLFNSYQAFEIMNSNLPWNEKVSQMGILAGSILGSIGFGMLGASLGMAGGPLVSIAGGLIGAGMGSIAGGAAGELLMGFLLGKDAPGKRQADLSGAGVVSDRKNVGKRTIANKYQIDAARKGRLAKNQSADKRRARSLAALRNKNWQWKGKGAKPFPQSFTSTFNASSPRLSWTGDADEDIDTSSLELTDLEQMVIAGNLPMKDLLFIEKHRKKEAAKLKTTKEFNAKLAKDHPNIAAQLAKRGAERDNFITEKFAYMRHGMGTNAGPVVVNAPTEIANVAGSTSKDGSYSVWGLLKTMNMIPHFLR